jgi:hypothetical protein
VRGYRVIALLYPNAALHAAARTALARHAGDDLKLPASAYAESLVGPARRGLLATAKAAIAALLLDLVPITSHVAEEAAVPRARHPAVRLAHALVVATGSVLGAAVVLTVDARWQQSGQAISTR